MRTILTISIFGVRSAVVASSLFLLLRAKARRGGKVAHLRLLNPVGTVVDTVSKSCCVYHGTVRHSGRNGKYLTLSSVGAIGFFTDIGFRVQLARERALIARPCKNMPKRSPGLANVGYT